MGLFRSLLTTLGACCLFLGMAGCAMNSPRPSGGETGPEAEALADKMLRSLGGAEAWERTRALRLQMNERRPIILWDRDRGMAEIVYPKRDDLRVVLNTHSGKGKAWSGKKRLAPDKEDKALATAQRDFFNDTFWLIAPFKIRDPGTRRTVVREGQESHLLVEYQSGGSTPGDAYLWEISETGRPTAWRMWVSILPVDGVRVVWSDWEKSPTGMLVAKKRNGPLGLSFEFAQLETAETLGALVSGGDPFAAP
jgi:hypothetical protein